MLSTDQAIKTTKRVQKAALEKTRELSKEAAPFADEAMALGATALTAAAGYAKSIGAVKAGKWAVSFARRNPVVLGLSVLGLVGFAVYAGRSKTTYS